MLRRGLTVLAVAGTLVLVAASPAFAHAELAESTPAPGAVLAKSPPDITLNFTETVRADNGGIRVFDTDGERVDHGGSNVSGSTVRLPVPELDDGSYVVTWRVVSADAHPIQGAFTFQVGEGGGPGATSRQVTGLANRLLGAQGGDRVVGVVYGIVRGLVFAGLALLIGGAVFAALISPRARRSKDARRLVGLGWGVTFGATIVGLLVYGPYVSGLGLGDAFSMDLLDQTLGERFGKIWLARVVVLLVALPLLSLLFRRQDAKAVDADADTDADTAPGHLPPWWLALGAAVAIALAASPALAGHASTGDWMTAAVVADTLHVLAMAVWLGGLVILGAVTLRRRDLEQLRVAVPRFSRVALGCITVLVATGAFQTWRQVGSLDALRSTDYGRILAVKLVLFAAVVVFAAFSREIVLRLFGEPVDVPPPVPAVAGGSDDDLPPADEPDDEYELDEEVELRHLRRSVWVEVALAICVLAATALLVNAAPAKTALAGAGDGGAVGVTMKSNKVWVDFSATPGIAGANDLHLNVLTPSGAPLNTQELTVSIASADGKIAPIDLPLRRLAPGHYYAPGFDVPIAGDWRVKANPLISEFQQPTLRGTVTFG